MLSLIVLISFIKTITRTTQIHQLIMFNYFQHNPIAEKWAERVATGQGRRRGFLTGWVESSAGGQPTPKKSKNTGFWPLHSRIWEGRPPRFSKVWGSGPPPPRPPSATPLRVAIANDKKTRYLYLSRKNSNTFFCSFFVNSKYVCRHTEDGKIVPSCRC